MAFKQTTQRSISKTPKQYFPTPCEGPKKRVASCTHAFGMQRSLLTPHNVRLGDLMPYGLGESDSDDDSDVSSITGTSDSGPNDRFDCDPYCSTKTLTKLVHNVQLLASGLERFTLARTTKMEHGGDIYLGTKGACNDEFHVSACRFNPANLVITLSDHDGKGKVDDSLQAITSIRRPMSSTDDETAALYQRVLARLYGYRSFSLKAGRALCETEIFTRLSQEIFPTIRRTITIHMYDIPDNIKISKAERKSFHDTRRKKLHKILTTFNRCCTLVIAFENYVVFQNSQIADFFLQNERRQGLKLEVRIGSIWSLPLETPKERMAKDGVMSTKVIGECWVQLAGLPLETDWREEYPPEELERLRFRLLVEMSKALGPGLVIRYGANFMHRTKMSSKEIWVWA